MKKVIITGASGFLGKKLLYTLLNGNVEVTAVVRSSDKLTVSESELLHIAEADLENYEELDRQIIPDSYDVFYHFAWAGTSGREREDAGVQTGNIKAACAAVRAAKKIGCRRFVNAGSLMEYEAMKLMQAQKIAPSGNYMYRSAKLAAHYLAETEAAKCGLSFHNLIISNVYGPGEVSDRFICSTLRKLIRSEENSFTDGTQLYDFIYVDDAMEAFYRVGEYGIPYKDYYIGNNHVRPLRKYIEELYDCLPTNSTPVFGSRSYDGISLTYDEFDRKGLEEDTGFCGRICFRDGIRNTYNWLKEHTDAEV